MKVDYVEKMEKIVRKDLWSPIVGDETTELMGVIKSSYGLDDYSIKKLQDESIDILSRCGNPIKLKNSETGIIIGYVQSGKTMSFTTVTALAKDNGYQLIIIIAGVSNPLLDQTTKRLESDLRYSTRRDRDWLFFKEPEKNQFDRIKNAIESWKDKSYPKHKRRVLLITIKKNSAVLRKLNDLFSKINLENVPSLIIDDEADQASLNTKAYKKNEREHSTIYALLKQFKEKFPHHTYLQYTATPQAPIFTNLKDILSPKFVRLLEPGDKYTGGKCFFLEHNDLVVPIESEKESEKEQHSPPNSLLDALRIYFLGVAQGESEGGKGNRSMLIHPSRLTIKHEDYFHWTKQIKKRWLSTLEAKSLDKDRLLLLKEFEDSYKILRKTANKLDKFENLAKLLPIAIKDTVIEEVNTRDKATPKIPWKDHYSFILVGGQAMDRGFTVEGLTITYMPRGKGGSNVDTLLQRSRFFGYKKDYLGFCRVYVPTEIIERLGKIVQHEDDIRSRLKVHEKDLDNLDLYPRKAILDRILRLTRRNVLSDEIESYKYGDDWAWTKAPHDSADIIKNNRGVIKDFIKSKKFLTDKGDARRTKDQTHLYCEADINEVLILLGKLKYTRLSDSENILNISTILEYYGNKKEKCLIYLMRKGKERERRLAKGKDEVENIFQGPNPTKPPYIYPGDKGIKKENVLTIQINNLRITESDGKTPIVDNTYALAIWVPDKFAIDFVRQKK